MISGFMIVKNVLKPGYPFVEAIASALPICDEFLISDGYSTDGTYEIVQKISKLNKKVKVFRQEWPREKKLAILGEATNAIRRKCRFNYIFHIQANEIVHEANIEFIKALPEMCPSVKTFSFPFLHLMWRYKWSQEFRLRFSKNLPYIVATGDAWSLGLNRKFVFSEISRSLRTPRQLARYFGRGVEWTYANSGGNIISRAIFLPRPIYRYWSLFPDNFLEKCAQHMEMFGISGFDKTIKNLRTLLDDPQTFWETATDLFSDGPLGFKYPTSLKIERTEDHPRLMRDFLDNTRLKSYFVRENILESIRDL